MSNIIQLNIRTKPLSVNKAWQGKRFRSKEYKSWAEEVQLLVASELSRKTVKKIEGNLEVTVELFIKNDKCSDADNPLKPLFDTLTACGVWEDDRKIYALHVYKEHAEEESVRVTIAPFE
jgi:Holliday junction resolvase RusA-like endonuclease